MGRGDGAWSVDLIEAAYRPAADDASWLEGLLGAARPGLDRGLGSVAVQFEVDGAGEVSFGSFVGLECPPRWREAFTRTLTDPTGDWARVAAAFGSCGTASELLPRLPSHRPRMQGAFALVGAKDAIAVVAIDPAGGGVTLTAPWAEESSVPARDRRRWARLAAHVAAGRRLRALGAPAIDDADAIFDPRGKLQHAAESVAGTSARAALRDAATAVVRASSRLRRSDPDAALETWRALFGGRWSLLDHFDTDGKRFLVARKNDPSAPPLPQLTLRERQVACYAALGHSNKLIAYELGLSIGTVSTHLTSAARKLGAPSRAALIRAMAPR